MLTVRFGQLTVRGLSPLKIRSLVGCSPNATLQAPPIAEARNERRLLAVACKRLLGAARVSRAALPPRPHGSGYLTRQENLLRPRL